MSSHRWLTAAAFASPVGAFSGACTLICTVVIGTEIASSRLPDESRFYRACTRIDNGGQPGKAIVENVRGSNDML